MSIENIQKCACLECPIQIENECAQNKIKNMQEMMKIEKNIVPNSRNIPGMYCITELAQFNEFNTNKTCKCTVCDIFKEYNLENSIDHFCKNSAK